MIPLVIKEETGSTNDDLWTAWGAGRREPLAVLALRQTAGRGRQGREWFSGGLGNLSLSGLYFLDAGRRELLPFIPLRAALAVIEALARHSGETVGLKWPNDLMLGERKCGGILAESRSAPGDLILPVVVGIGLNLNGRLEDFPPRLREVVGVPVPPVGGRFPLIDIARDIIYTLGVWFAA